ncbi:serine/threonine-protein kinase PkaA-like [Babylonia areolata]|uniref:serine/threonine-protein kinase PkaA-like n=1 Tax=Babylonia areolata TaxID=304850 RepID=UPI003FD2452C
MEKKADDNVQVIVIIPVSGKQKRLYRLTANRHSEVESRPVPGVRQEDVVLATRQEGTKTVADRIGCGAFGVVYRAALHQPGGPEEVVVKQFIRRSVTREDVVREAQFLRHLQDTSYVPRVFGILHGWGSIGGGLCLVQSLFAEGITLKDVENDLTRLPKYCRLYVARNMALGLQAIHDRGVVINDLHGRNVLVDVRTYRKPIKYIDMGLARHVSTPTLRFVPEVVKSCKHLAPEVRAGRPATQASDAYSLGRLIRDLNLGNEAKLTSASRILMAKDPAQRDLARVTALLDFRR